MDVQSRYDAISKALSDLQRKDRWTLRDITEMSAMRQELDKMYRQLHGEPKVEKREFAPFKPLSETLQEIREHFNQRRAVK